MVRILKIIETKIDSVFNITKIYKDYLNKNILFFDIETTGFSPLTSEVYLIGCLIYQENSWNLIQFFSESSKEEKKILVAFQQLCNLHPVYIHFNGESFDIPYIRKKFQQYHLEGFPSDMKQIDLFKKIKSYHLFLQLDNYRLSTLMDFVGIERQDIFTGGEMIKYYYQYRKNPSRTLQNRILLHNKEDLLGLPALFSIIQNIQLLKQSVNKQNFSIQKIKQKENELQGKILLNSPLSINLFLNQPWGKMILTKEESIIKIVLYLCYKTLYHFFPNYKEYYYLPKQDEAIHKSIGKFVDPSRREQAKASNCYIKRKGYFLPIFQEINQIPMFSSIEKDKKFILISSKNIEEVFVIWYNQYLKFTLG